MRPDAQATNRVLEDDSARIAIVDGQITLTHKETIAPVHEAAPRTERGNATLTAEQEAGRRRVEFYKEQDAKRPPRVIPAKEQAATGRSIPVFRPGDRIVAVSANGAAPSQIPQLNGTYGAPVKPPSPFDPALG